LRSRPTAANRACELLPDEARRCACGDSEISSGTPRVSPARHEMDGRDQQQQQQVPPPAQPQPVPQVASPPPPHAAFGAAPPGAPNVMPLGFNPMASQGASPPMKPADMPPGAMFRPDAAPVNAVQQPGSAGGEFVKKKRGRPRKYGPDGSIGPGPKSAESGGGGSNSNPDGKRRGRPPGSGKKKQLDALGNIAPHQPSAHRWIL
jgi:hypothetical protein